jgi:hypothetical protein
MIATTTFTAARAVDKALEHLRFGHGAEQHDGLAGRALRHGGIRAVPDDPNGARPSLASTADIFGAFGHYIPLATAVCPVLLIARKGPAMTQKRAGESGLQREAED